MTGNSSSARVLWAVATSDGFVSSKEVAEKLDIRHNTASKQLHVLYESDLLIRTRKGKAYKYRIRP